MGAVAKRGVAGVLALAEVGGPIFFRRKCQGGEISTGMGTVAERLIL